MNPVQILLSILATIGTYMSKKHDKESLDKSGAVTTQIAALPVIAGAGTLTMVDLTTEEQAITFAVSALASLALWVWRSGALQNLFNRG